MKKLFAIAALAALGLSTAAFAEVTGSSRKTRDGRQEIQALLNECGANLAEDGVFGRMTIAAIKSFQRENDLTADGIVGNKTANMLNDCADLSEEEEAAEEEEVTTPSEALCPNGMTLASNCTTAPAATPATPTTPSTLSGPEGNLTNIVKLGSYNNTKVTEGQTDQKVLGIELTAKDGDQKIDGINLAFYNSNGSTSSAKITKYATEISVWLDGVEIGRKLASQFSDDAGDVYTYRFSGMNGITKMNQKSQLIVAVSAVNSMDSTDATNSNWAVSVGSSTTAAESNFISAASANGRYRDFGSDTGTNFTSTIDFQKAGGVSSDQKFKVNTSSTSPLARTVQVSTTADTNDQTLLAFDVKAENGAMIIQKLPITLTTTGTDSTVSNQAVVKSLKLYANGVKLGDESTVSAALITNAACTASATPYTWCTGAAAGTAPSNTSQEVIVFGNTSKLNYKVDANATVKFEVRADLNDTEDTAVIGSDFDNGDKVSASYSSANVTASTIELDNVNQDTVSNRSGSATGEDQTLRSTGLQVSLGSVTTEATTNQSGEILTRTIKVPVTMKAFDETMYVSQAALYTLTPDTLNGLGLASECTAGATPYTWCTGAGTGTIPTSAISFSVEEDDGSVIDAAITNSVTWTSTDATVESGAYRIDSGTTKNFTLNAVLTGATGDAQKQFRLQLDEVNAFTNSGLSTGQTVQDLTPANSFETGYYTLNEDDL